MMRTKFASSNCRDAYRGPAGLPEGRGGARALSPRRATPLIVPVTASRPLTFLGGAVAALVAVTVGGWGLWGLLTVERAVATPPPPVSARGPEIEVHGLHMVETKDGSKLWEVRADKAEVFERDGVTHLRRVGAPVEVVLHSDEGVLTAAADEAVVDLRSKDVTLRGDVRGRSDRGTDLRTDSLHWVAATRLLHTPDPVVLTRGGLVSVGKGMEAETNLERVRLLGGISSQMSASPEEPPAPPRPAGSARRAWRR